MSLSAFYFFEFVMIFMLLSWGIYLPFRAHQLYYGPVYWLAISGYFCGFAAKEWGWPFWLAMIVVVIASALISFPIAYKFALLGVLPMSLATIGIVFIAQIVAMNLDFLGGANGLFGVPYVQPELLLTISIILVIIVGFIIYRIDHSYLGRAMDAAEIRDVATTLGINVIMLSVFLQVSGSILGAIAGGLYVFTLSGMFPQAFDFFLILYAVAIVIVGGRYTVWGVIIATPILWGFTQIVPEAMKTYSNIAYALLLIIVLVARPSGAIDRKTVRSISTGGRALLTKLTGRC